MSQVHDFATENFDRFIEELFDFIRIPSVSTQEEHKADVKRAAQWLVDHLKSIGIAQAEVMETPGHPIVYAEWLEAGENKPTVLIYGHYDVQPAAKSDGWTTANPFVAEIHDGNIIARGATDDKGQVFMHLKVIESFMKSTGKLPINIKILIEGEEEASSLNLPDFVENNRDLLKADVAVISDTAMQAPGIPAIPYGLRGIVLADLAIYGPERDLHSGMYGGSVHNPIHALAQLVSTFHDADGRVAIQGFNDDVRDLDAEEREQLAAIGYDEATWRKETGAPQPWGDPDYTIYERMGARPTLDLTMIKSGQVSGGIKNIIPKTAEAHLTCRLVPNQDPNQILELIRQHIENHLPPTVSFELKKIATNPAVLVDRHSEAMKKAIAAYKNTFDREPLFPLVGGSIPVVTDFQDKLQIPVIMMGFGLPDDNLHAPNEKFGLEQFRLGVHTLTTYYQMLAE